MTHTATPTGRREQRDGARHLVLTRTFAAPLAAVWAAVAEPERMQRWIGTFSGDPASGEVAFRMTAEGDDVPVETYVVEACRPPHHYAVRSRDPQPWREDGTGEPMVWRLVVDLAETDGVTTLTFAQTLDRADAGEIAASVGPGWEYYLDRLVADLDGTGADAVQWGEQYHPGMASHYERLLGD
ncbi:hypothetical protein GCM10023340_11850 [Nocardioides marinquilinus]|uniref:Activator of Hsp90 ATPase homologue 1/2-like C-terminal domain-containing protein n=1 Tax=Nocardioides marinquilinus TaxID=1210400 RepID=A0ABP9PC89_9ACTN